MSTIVDHGILQDKFATSERFTNIAAQAGDRIYTFIASYWPNTINPVQWGNANAVRIGGIDNQLSVWQLDVAETGSHDLILSFDAYTNFNAHYRVVRPDVAFAPGNSVVNITSSGAATLTSSALGANGRVIDFIDVLGEFYWGERATTTATSNTNLLDTAQHNWKYPNQSVGSTLTGNGQVTSSYSVTPNTNFLFAQVEIKESNFSITGLTSPLVPGAAFTATCGGFNNGAATLSFSGVSMPVVIAGGEFSGVIPMVADNISWPKLPATNRTITLTQGDNSAVVSRNISLPAGWDVVRDIDDAPANFSGFISGDTTYLQYWFIAASNALTTSDTAIFPTANDFKIAQDSGVTAKASSLPLTESIFIYRGAVGKYFSHSAYLSDDSAAQDSTPNPVTISWPSTGTFITNAFLIEGVDAGANVNLQFSAQVGCTATYSINNAAFTSADGVSHLGDSIRVKLIVDDPAAIEPKATLMIGGSAVTFYAPVNGGSSVPQSSNFVAEFM